jgi:PadR family transcriptional regulator, regulatory protein PadR
MQSFALFLPHATLLEQGTNMENNINEKFSAIRKGLLEFAVMNVIKAEPVYAADIIERLASTEFSTQEGTLYPLLSKMRRDQLLDYDWQESESGPPRKYYRLTSQGKERLAETEAYWQKIITTLKNLNK